MEKFYKLLVCTIVWFIACRLDVACYGYTNIDNYAGWIIIEGVLMFYTIKSYIEATK